MRSTREVIDSHLECRSAGDLEADIEKNYDENVILFHIDGKEHGHDGMRKSGCRLEHQLPESSFRFKSLQIEGPYAYLEWEADSPRYKVRDGADSFVIEDGKIVMQSVHYRLQEE